jgi:hypothetical protein
VSRQIWGRYHKLASDISLCSPREFHRNVAPESILIRTKDKAAKLAQLDMFLPGDVMLADRLMCTWTEMVMRKQRGVESVCRLRSHHTADFRRSEP